MWVDEDSAGEDRVWYNARERMNDNPAGLRGLPAGRGVRWDCWDKVRHATVNLNHVFGGWGVASDVEPEMDDVAVIHNILLPLNMQ